MTVRPLSRLRRARRALATILVLALASSWPAGASGQEQQEPVWQRIPDDRLSPGLVQLPVDSSAYRSAVSAWQRTLSDIDRAQRTITESEASLTRLVGERADLRTQLTTMQEQLAVALADRDVIDRSIDHLAVRRYVSGGPVVNAIDLIGSPNPADDIYDRAVAEQVSDAQLDKRTSLGHRVDDLQRDEAARTDELVQTGTSIVETQATLDETRKRLDDLRASVPTREQAVRDTRMGALVADTDMTLVALDAYVKAAARVRRDRPSCGIQWWMIAALGRIESRHGTIFGSQVRPDGRTTVRIIGIPLDGTNKTLRVLDTDHGELDGDTVYDRAVGPMQFIPETWTQFRRDGNGDGVRDPHNMYDAAYGAAAFLCARGGSLDADGLRRAYLAYNRSDEYVDTAIQNGATYRTLSIPTP